MSLIAKLTNRRVVKHFVVAINVRSSNLMMDRHEQDRERCPEESGSSKILVG